MLEAPGDVRWTELSDERVNKGDIGTLVFVTHHVCMSANGLATYIQPMTAKKHSTASMITVVRHQMLLGGFSPARTPGEFFLGNPIRDLRGCDPPLLYHLVVDMICELTELEPMLSQSELSSS